MTKMQRVIDIAIPLLLAVNIVIWLGFDNPPGVYHSIRFVNDVLVILLAIVSISLKQRAKKSAFVEGQNIDVR